MTLVCAFADNKPLLIGILAGIVGIIVVAIVVNAIQQHIENKRELEPKPEDFPQIDTEDDDTEPRGTESKDPSASEEEALEKGSARPNHVGERPAVVRTANSAEQAGGDASSQNSVLLSDNETKTGGKTLDGDDWSEL